MRQRIPPELAPPCSRAQMNKLGKRLIASKPPSDDDIALYREVIVFHDEIKSIAQAALDRHRWHKVIGRPVELAVTGRAKTRGTLMDKLRRTPGLGLGYIRDIAGVRIVGAVSLSEQDAIARAAGDLFGPHKLIDLRDGSHMGYRAVHVLVEIAGGSVEVQVRTSLQAGRAELYERTKHGSSARSPARTRR